MYFPYVRGRQYELLALRDLAKYGLLSSKILPVVEPVKLSSTLLTTMEEFVKNNKKLAIVCNPSVGSFSNEMKDEEKGSNRRKFWDLLGNNMIVKAHIMNPNSDKQLEVWKNTRGIQKDDWLIVCNKRDFVDSYLTIFKDITPQYVLIPDEYRRKIRKGRVLFEDKFKKCDRNSDYLKNPDEFYSEDHLYFKEDGFIGFGDYSIIGNDYMEAGFAPYAVAVHIIYFNQDKSLRIHHFVSDSNEDIQNPAKKFYEALDKLKKSIEQYNIPKTMGITKFLQYYDNEMYPGLGSVKKLSLMHHLELMGRYLDGVK